jgi:hypothetical protein
MIIVVKKILLYATFVRKKSIKKIAIKLRIVVVRYLLLSLC